MKDRLLKVEEIALSVGVSVKTINTWYAFKKKNPNNIWAKLLPDFKQDNNRGVRFWKQSDVWKLIEFRQKIPKGRKGIMGSVTQKYVRKNKEDIVNGT